MSDGKVTPLNQHSSHPVDECAAVSEERKAWQRELNKECLVSELAEKLLVASFRTQFPQSAWSCISAAENLVNELESRRKALIERQPA